MCSQDSLSTPCRLYNHLSSSPSVPFLSNFILQSEPSYSSPFTFSPPFPQIFRNSFSFFDFMTFIIFWFPYPFSSLLPLSSPILFLQILKPFLTSLPGFLHLLYLDTLSPWKILSSSILNLSYPFWLSPSFPPNISLQCHSLSLLPVSSQTSMLFFSPFL